MGTYNLSRSFGPLPSASCQKITVFPVNRDKLYEYNFFMIVSFLMGFKQISKVKELTY
jgi:hypothetical protein